MVIWAYHILTPVNHNVHGMFMVQPGTTRTYQEHAADIDSYLWKHMLDLPVVKGEASSILLFVCELNGSVGALSRSQYAHEL